MRVARGTCNQAVWWGWTGATETGGSLLKNKAYWEVELDPFFVLGSKGYFEIKHTKNFPVPPPSNK